MFDVLGELFEGHALRDLLVDAIRYGDRPETKAELFRKVDGAVDVGAIEQLVAERKLTSEGMDPNAVAAVREEMERAQARRLQPHFIGSFFREAFTLLGGRIAERERGRFEITRVECASAASEKTSAGCIASFNLGNSFARSPFHPTLAWRSISLGFHAALWRGQGGGQQWPVGAISSAW